MNNVLLALVTGLTTGGISCLAVQGGFLLTALVDNDDQSKKNRITGILAFLVSKLFIYTLLGFGLGLIGSKLFISPILLGWMQIIVGLYMFLTVGRLLNIHPFFKRFVIPTPKFAIKFMRDKSKTKSIFAPAVLGMATVLIPCGVTQAMMALAITTADPLMAAAIMFAFVLGTSPLFFTLGFVTSELFQKKLFVYTASVSIFIIALISINNGQVLRGSYHTLQNYYLAAKSLFQENTTSQLKLAKIENGIQKITINVSDYGYSSPTTALKVGVPVKATIVSNNVRGCAKVFTIPSFGVTKVLPDKGSTEIEFTPTKTGLLTYSCSMGMYTGQFTIID